MSKFPSGSWDLVSSYGTTHSSGSWDQVSPAVGGYRLDARSVNDRAMHESHGWEWTSADWEQVSSGVDDFKLDAKFVNDRTIHKSHSWKSTVTEWEQVRKIGQGGFATVFLQKEVGKEKFRAVKRIQRLKPSDSERELNILIRARGHKNLFVEFLSWYEDERNDFTYLVMEYMPHGNLKEYIQGFPAKSKENASKITKQLLRGLNVLHGMGIIHRDLKPQNVLIGSLSPVIAKLSDFGVSRILTEDKSMTITGSQTYMAPEMLGFLPPFRPLKRYTFAVDIWSLGCIVYELLTSRSPFKDAGYTTFDPQSPNDIAGRPFIEEFCSGEADFSRSLKPEVGNRAVYFVKRLLVADPASRITVVDALGLAWLLEFPNEDSQESEATRHQFMSLGSHLGLEADHEFMLACTSYSDEDKITPVLLSLSKWEVLRLLYTAASKGYKLAIEALSPYMRRKSMDFSWWPSLCLQVAAECGQIEVVRLLWGDLSIHINSILLPQAPSTNIVLFNERLGLHLGKFAPTPNSFRGRTLLQAAAGSGHVELVELLISLYNADVNAKPNRDYGRTALQAAAEGGHVDLVKLLISSYNANVNAEQCHFGGRTALQAAAEGGHVGVVEFLVSHGADIDAGPGLFFGRTAVQAAAERGHVDVVDFLVSHKADVNAGLSITGGITALEAAKRGRHTEVEKLLRSVGAT